MHTYIHILLRGIICMHTYARHLNRIRGNVNAEWYQAVGKKRMPEKEELEEDGNGT